jgi:hypothetical protein
MTAKSAIHQTGGTRRNMGGIRRNLSMKLMRSLWLSFAGAAL